MNKIIGIIEDSSMKVVVEIKGSGPRGEQGLPGDKGERGLQGDKGDAGPRGEQGPKGEQGEQGEDGYTPIKGVDYFDGEDGLQGEQGIQGLRGNDGERGLQGIKGDDGYTPIKGTDYFDGIDGVDGQDGDKGDKGDKGEQGPKGDKGDKGDPGVGGGSIVDLGTFNDQTELITHVVMNQLPTGHYTFIIGVQPFFMLLRLVQSLYMGTFQDNDAVLRYFEVTIYGEIMTLKQIDLRDLMTDVPL